MEILNSKVDASIALKTFVSFSIIILAFLFPVLYEVYVSTPDWALGKPEIQFIGLGNYLAFPRQKFLAIVSDNLIFASSTIALTITISLIMSPALNKEFKGAGIYKTR